MSGGLGRLAPQPIRLPTPPAPHDSAQPSTKPTGTSPILLFLLSIISCPLLLLLSAYVPAPGSYIPACCCCLSLLPLPRPRLRYACDRRDWAKTSEADFSSAVDDMFGDLMAMKASALDVKGIFMPPCVCSIESLKKYRVVHK